MSQRAASERPVVLLLETIHPDAESELASVARVVLAQSSGRESSERERDGWSSAGASPADPGRRGDGRGGAGLDDSMQAGGCDMDGTFDPSDVVAVVTRGRGQVDRELLDSLPRLQAVARCGVGLDNIDTDRAAERGVAVIFAPGSTTRAVAEHTLMLTLALSRSLLQAAGAVKQGDWAARDRLRSDDLAGKVLGVVGLGAIGRRVAALGSAFEMEVLFTSRSSRDERWRHCGLAELLGKADVVSLHVALSDETRGLLGERELSAMRRGALLVNTARGALVDREALLDALDRGPLAGYAADVLSEEPPTFEDALIAHPKALITPHSAALTESTYRQMCVTTVRNLVAHLRGGVVDRELLYRPPR